MIENNSYAEKYIGGYHISLELASSTSSRVFLGESVSPDRHSAAIKKIHAITITSRQDKENFLQEVNVLKQLKHPYLLPLLSASILKGIPYIISEYAPNGSLHDRLQRSAPKPMAQDEAISILSQVGQALHYAHQMNRIHGNLKPQNILFNGKGDALLADFKLASLSSLADDATIASPHGYTYMSAEQIDGIDCKENDLYSLGCIAYEMFTGRKPFATPSIKQPGIYYKTKTLIAPTKLNPTLPRSIEQAILKAMAKEPSQRYRSVLEFTKALATPEAPVDERYGNSLALSSQKNISGKPLFPGLKMATTGATTFAQFTARNALLRNTFTSLARFSTLPLINGSLVVPFSQPQKRKALPLRPLLLVASLVLIIALIAAMAFAFSSSRIQQGNKASTGTRTTIPSQAPTKTATKHATFTPTKTTQRITIPAQPIQPTQAPQRGPTVRPSPQPLPTHTPPPTATIPPKTTLSIAPTVLNATNCTRGNGSYTCTVALSLGAGAGSSQNWYTYSIGVGASFSPSSGTIVPGQVLTIQITVFDTCTKTGTFVFVGSKTNVTTSWKC